MDQANSWLNAHATAVGYLALTGVLVLLGERIRRAVRQWRAPLPETEQQIMAVSERRLFSMPARARLVRGALTGLAVPGGLSLFSLGALLISGRYQVRTGSREDELVLFVATLAGSSVWMAILMLCMPWCRRLTVAVVAGSAAILPLVAGVVASQDNHLTHWTAGATWASILFSVAIGGGSGLVLSHNMHRVEAARQSLETSST
jgi:hypothetical protein